ncbi:MAG: hypothetical protein QOJ33_1405, partial [Chloroflexota bacterium]|nr:hypothetical protein [Chloroflexota bacterium]
VNSPGKGDRLQLLPPSWLSATVMPT